MVHTLIVDDNVGIAHALQTVLENAGHKTLIATTEAEVARYFTQPDTISLIMMDDDIRNPYIKRLPAWLKSNPSMQHIRVIFYSGELRLENSDYVRWLGADAVWTYPSPAHDLLNTINGLFHQHTA